MSSLKIKPEKYSQGLQLCEEVTAELHNVVGKIIHRVVGNAAVRAKHNSRSTIMNSDIVNFSCDENTVNGISGTNFNNAIQTELGDNNNFKFSNGVKKTLQKHTEAALGNLMVSLKDKEVNDQLALLKRGMSIQNVPEFSVETFSFKSTAGVLQKLANPSYITSEKAKVYLQTLASTLASLLAHQSGQQSAKTISEKDVRLSASVWLPHEYAKVAIEQAENALEKYNSSKVKKDVKKKTKSKKVDAKTELKNVGRRTRAGLDVAVSSSENIIRTLNSKKNISATAPVYFAGVLQGVFVKLLTDTIPYLEESKKKTLTPVFLQKTITASAELSSIFESCLSDNM
tara:strand:- start:8989 stop:10017 length:1029 start_codon:yes stop_codon:yes gene_type:complete